MESIFFFTRFLLHAKWRAAEPLPLLCQRAAVAFREIRTRYWAVTVLHSIKGFYVTFSSHSSEFILICVCECHTFAAYFVCLFWQRVPCSPLVPLFLLMLLPRLELHSHITFSMAKVSRQRTNDGVLGWREMHVLRWHRERAVRWRSWLCRVRAQHNSV